MTASADNFWVASEVIRSLVNWGVECGLERRALLGAVNTTDANLNDLMATFSARQYMTLLDAMAEMRKDDLCGFYFGAAAEPDRWGVLGHIMTCCHTLGEALYWQQRYQALVGSIGHVTMTASADRVILAWQTALPVTHHLAEEVTAGWVRFARWVTGTDHSPLAVHHQHRRSAVPSAMQSFYRCEVHFDATFNGLIFPSRFLALPLKQPNTPMLKMMDAHARALFLKMQSQAAEPVGFQDKLRQFIVRFLPDNSLALDKAAVHLHVSRRTLQRRLNENGLTFRELVDAVRHEQAEHYLRTTEKPNLTELTLMLGFSSSSTLTRAFQRWTGMTPSDFITRSR